MWCEECRQNRISISGQYSMVYMALKFLHLHNTTRPRSHLISKLCLHCLFMWKVYVSFVMLKASRIINNAIELMTETCKNHVFTCGIKQTVFKFWIFTNPWNNFSRGSLAIIYANNVFNVRILKDQNKYLKIRNRVDKLIM